MKTIYKLIEKRQYLLTDKNGFKIWCNENISKEYNPCECAIIICDVWDNHWCSGANIRLNDFVYKINDLAVYLRNCGTSIIHAPSDTISYYNTHQARLRILDIPRIDIPEYDEIILPPLPFDIKSEGCDNNIDMPYKAWNCQHDAVKIDDELDVISDNGDEIYSYLKHKGIRKVFIMGVHTNMCIINRSFGVKRMNDIGIDISLIRDLTDAMYDPESTPYVSHEMGTELTCGYIEKFICSTVVSEDFLL